MGICSPPKQAIDQPSPNTPAKKYNREQMIANSKYKHLLYEFCQRLGYQSSDQAREWATSIVAQTYHSTTKMLDGSQSSRNSREEFLSVFDLALTKKWTASVKLISGIFDKKGTQEWIAWIYILVVPNQADRSRDYLFVYSAVSVFCKVSGVWVRSEYNQMETG